MRLRKLTKLIKPIFLLSALIGGFFWLRGAVLSLVIPKKVEIDLTTRKVRAAISGQQFHLVDQDGVVLGKSASATDYPLIFLEPEVNLDVGQRYSQSSILYLLNLITEMEMRLLEPKMVKAQLPHRFLFWLEDGTEVIFSDDKEIKEQLDSLQLIYERSKMEGRSFKRIDLRYSKPVISQ